MLTESTHWYPSKVDWWVAVVLCIPPLSSIVVCVALALGGKQSEMLIGLAAAFFVFCLYRGLVFPLRYGLDEEFLHLRFGLVKQRIPLPEIIEVLPTRNPLSSPALSLDRLHVQFGQGMFKAVMISPADRDRFLDELSQKTGLKREGDRLFRA